MDVLSHPHVVNSSYKRQREGHLLQKMFFSLQMGPHCLPRSEYTFVQGCPLWGHESPQGGASLVESNLQKLSLPVAVVGKDKQGVSAVTSFDEETVSLSRSHKPVSGSAGFKQQLTGAAWLSVVLLSHHAFGLVEILFLSLDQAGSIFLLIELVGF